MSSAGIREWFRVCRVVVGAWGQGVELSNLRIAFEVVKTVDAIPNSATIRVYNLNNDNVAAIQQDYEDVIIKAGYAGGEAQIFAGNIQYVSHYRQGPDYITEITAADGDRDYRNAYISETLAAGTTDVDVVDRCIGNMTKTRKGTVQISGAPQSRGTVLQGPVREILSQVAMSNACNWSIQDGQLQMVRADSKIGQAIVVSAQTGLLEAPERNDKGIAARCLLNPNFHINGVIKLDNEAIRVKAAKPKILKQERHERPPVRLNPDGIYKIIKLTHSGDNRGNEWYSLLECIDPAQPIPTTRTSVRGGAVPVGGADWGESWQ